MTRCTESINSLNCFMESHLPTVEFLSTTNLDLRISYFILKTTFRCIYLKSESK